jgi:hypothetical protein
VPATTDTCSNNHAHATGAMRRRTFDTGDKQLSADTRAGQETQNSAQKISAVCGQIAASVRAIDARQVGIRRTARFIRDDTKNRCMHAGAPRVVGSDIPKESPVNQGRLPVNVDTH